jgi:glutathione synthase/RimK-type ligase-like ATP-grasp enzyme
LDTASYKPLQYHVAKHRFGLAIPRTLITSDPRRAREFVEALGAENCIAKPLGRPVIDYGDSLTYFFTNRLDDDALQDIEQVRYGPCILQNFIEKSFEVRVTVIGDQVFAAKLATEGVAKAEVDWRRAALDDLPHEPMTIPEHLARACVGMCRHFNLRFGAFDFIVDRDDAWYFLEVNPNGQWLWIEHKTGWPLSAAMADELTQNA